MAARRVGPPGRASMQRRRHNRCDEVGRRGKRVESLPATWIGGIYVYVRAHSHWTLLLLVESEEGKQGVRSDVSQEIPS